MAATSIAATWPMNALMSYEVTGTLIMAESCVGMNSMPIMSLAVITNVAAMSPLWGREARAQAAPRSSCCNPFRTASPRQARSPEPSRSSSLLRGEASSSPWSLPRRVWAAPLPEQSTSDGRAYASVRVRRCQARTSTLAGPSALSVQTASWARWRHQASLGPLLTGKSMTS